MKKTEKLNKIIFDLDKTIDDMRKEGIKAKSPDAYYKLQLLIQWYETYTKYSREKIYKMIKEVANDYFSRMPAGQADKVLDEISRRPLISAVKLYGLPDKSIVVYESEWNKIKQLNSRYHEKLAWIVLLTAKVYGRYEKDGEVCYASSIDCKDSDLCDHADLPKTEPHREYWHTLTTEGYINYYCSDCNYSSGKMPKLLFTVPYRVDTMEDKTNEKVKFVIKNLSNPLLYYKYYSGLTDNLSLCQQCGAPIPAKKGKQFCDKCAKERKNTKKMRGEKIIEK